MKFHKLTVLLAALCPLMLSAADNVAYQDNTVRFTVITDGTVRIEYAPDGKFHDGKSFIAVERDYPASDFKVSDSKGRVRITTPRMVIDYKKDGKPLTASNLSISTPAKAAVPFKWTPGMDNKGNLLGTYRTLDEYDGNMRRGQPMPIEDGLLSTEGWTLIDDSKGYVFDDSDWEWVAHRNTAPEATDWYFMAYGHDYKQALKDFTVFSGKVPLPPRYAFGYWWSRYWHYSDNDLRELVENMEEYTIPLDVLVVDMDWHYISDGLGGWTGYTWNKRLFPKADGMMKWLHDKNLKVTMNLHPADGIKPFEAHYADMARHLGIDTTGKPDIPWDASSKKFMTGWFDTQLKPLERDGVDFWWLDWQQWAEDKAFPNLSNIWWINYTTFTNMERTRPERPMIYHRWGGLGNHRYQIGFSGDSHITWASLDFQPYYNSTASNVLYGFWSHDIGGHYNAPAIDPELYIRWMQFGLLNPILRTHSTKSEVLNKEPWEFKHEHSKILRDIVHKRYALAPYIYTMARKAHDTGVSLCRPMYYDYPDNTEAYDRRNQYMFGENILVDPITSPMSDGVSVKEVWLPEGNDWWEMSTGTLLKGGTKVERQFLLDEYPYYAKAGSIIPMYEGTLHNLKGNDNPVAVTVIPGADYGEFTMYEDNGDDKNYATEYATTLLQAVREGNRLTVTINPAEGSYKDMPARRDFTVKAPGSVPPESVKINGVDAPWSYNGNELTLSVKLPARDLRAKDVVEIIYPADAPDVTDGLAGRFRRIHDAVFKAKQHDAGIVISEDLGVLESTGLGLEYYPEEFNERLARFREVYNRLPSVLEQQDRFPAEDIPAFIRKVN